MAAQQQQSRRRWVGFDLGATKMLAVVFDDRFRPIARKRKKTKGQQGTKGGVARTVALIEEALDAAGASAEQLAAIGIGCPGPLDLDRGIVREMPNLGWKNVPLKAELEKTFGCPAAVVNDVDAGVYGEYRFGAAKGARCVVGVFPGTGIGGGAVYQGSILRGARGSCLEIGHIPVMVGGPLCGCGRRGCLEAIAGRLAVSAQAAVAAYRGAAPHLLSSAGTDLADIRSRALSDAIAAGDRVVEEIVCDAARWVGWAMAGVVNLLAPDVVLIGGGMAEDMPELWRREVEGALKARVMPSFENAFKVALAELAGNATVIGAAAWAQKLADGEGV